MSRVAIVGGGLAGVYAAWRLHQAGVPVDLYEARPRLGGRILSTPDSGLDLGPTWFWPAFQPRITRLARQLGLEVFRQHEHGDALFELAPGQLRRHAGQVSETPGWRFPHGTIGLIEALAATLPARAIHLDTVVTAMTRQDGQVLLHGPDGQVLASVQTVWLALPPRLMSGIATTPPLPQHARERLAAVPTWMAGQAKYVARYATPFWREQGLSGDAFSRVGPLGELHDACNMRSAALFGFFGVDAATRARWTAERLREACRAQLGRLFGPMAAEPLEDWIQDWADEPFTTTPSDRQASGGHRQFMLDDLALGEWTGVLKLVGSEMDATQGGYLEGALAAVDRVLGD